MPALGVVMFLFQRYSLFSLFTVVLPFLAGAGHTLAYQNRYGVDLTIRGRVIRSIQPHGAAPTWLACQLNRV